MKNLALLSLALTCVLLAPPAHAQVAAPAPAALREQGSTGAVNLTASSADCSVAGSCATIKQQGASTYAVNISGTFVGTLQFEGSIDNGTTFVSVKAVPLAGGAAVTSATSTGQWQIAAAGLRQMRVRCSTYVSGTAVAWVNASSGTNQGVGTVAQDATVSAMSAKLPAALGATTSAASISTAPATDAFYPASASVSGGSVPFFNDAVAGTAVQVKATKGQLYALSLANTTAATAYLQIFCKPSASVTLGTTVADFVIRLKTNAGAGDERDITFPTGVCSLLADGSTAGTGITIAGTTTATGLTGAAISVAATFK